MRLADYVIDRLAKAGIGHAFTVVGGGSIFLNDALRASGRMTAICVHHEQAASIAAEAYARAGEGVGLAMVTSGPGGTNAVTGVAGAWLDHVPTITISGQVFSSQTIEGRPEGLRQVGVQEINIIDVVRPITKYAAQVRRPELIRYELEAALYYAREGRPGPVWLDIPADVQRAEVDPERLDPFEAPSVIARECWGDAAKVMTMLCAAKRPVLHIGQGVRLAGAAGVLEEFMRRSGIPVLTARNANDMIASDDPQYIGRPGTFAQRGANFAVQSCDLYIAVGTRLCLAQTGYNSKDYARNANIVHVDIDAAELAKGTLDRELTICADARHFLNALVTALPEKLPDWSPWLARCKALQAKYPPEVPPQLLNGINTYQVADKLSDLAPADAVVVTDMGFAFQTMHQAFRVKKGQRFFTNGGLAAMGWGLPAAIGAHYATEREVICVVGDGGLMMNLQELATVAHNQLPIKIILLNNDGYLTMRQSQALAFDGYIGSDKSSGVGFPDFQRVVCGFGLGYDSAKRQSQLDDGLDWLFRTDGPALLELICDPDQVALKSVNRRMPDGSIQQTSIEDAYPHLDRAEIEENLRTEE